jgi:hypothetical protein
MRICLFILEVDGDGLVVDGDGLVVDGDGLVVDGGVMDGVYLLDMIRA